MPFVSGVLRVQGYFGQAPTTSADVFEISASGLGTDAPAGLIAGTCSTPGGSPIALAISALLLISGLWLTMDF